MVWRKGSYSFNKNQFQGTEYITYWKRTWNLTMLYKNVSFMLHENTHQFVGSMLVFRMGKRTKYQPLVRFHEDGLFQGDLHKRSLWKRPPWKLHCSVWVVSSHFGRFSKKLLEDQEEELEGKVVGITKSIIRLDNDIIIPWLKCLLKAQYLTPKLWELFMLSTLEVSHRNPMATPWPGFQISAMLFFVEHSCSFYKDDMMAGRIPGMHTLVQKYLDISVCCCRWAAWVSCVQKTCGSCTM